MFLDDGSSTIDSLQEHTFWESTYDLLNQYQVIKTAKEIIPKRFLFRKSINIICFSSLYSGYGNSIYLSMVGFTQ